MCMRASWTFQPIPSTTECSQGNDPANAVCSRSPAEPHVNPGSHRIRCNPCSFKNVSVQFSRELKQGIRVKYNNGGREREFKASGISNGKVTDGIEENSFSEITGGGGRALGDKWIMTQDLASEGVKTR